MSQPSLIHIDYWRNFEQSVLETFIIALNILKSEPNLPLREDRNGINRVLYDCVLKTRHSYVTEDDLNWVPVCEAQNQPDLEKEFELNEGKRPDFLCSIHDRQELNYKRSFKALTIECKRLGSPSRPSWKFNENYISNGVQRFMKKEWGYGTNALSGIMIGYVQSMDLNEILGEVNKQAVKEKLPEIVLSTNGWQIGDISNLKHQLMRLEILPNNFQLFHLWVDLRSN